ncbi:MAG: glycosyltransferase family 2 protein, partial [Chthoniobacterales bacterium]
MPLRAPVVFLVFNRPELTARVFERIRAAQPQTLLIVSDGPRPDQPDDNTKVAAVRSLLAAGIDWPCDVRRNYADHNLGCASRVSSGITWAFEQVEEAIILEDDCLPHPSFFHFCDEMLARYRDSERVMHIGGTNLAAARMRPPAAGYWFSRHSWVWGWATWRRAWQSYDFPMAAWESRLQTLEQSYASPWERRYWMPTLDRTRRELKKANTWDYSWHFTCRSLGGLAILSARNLIENIGFGVDHTHTPLSLERLRQPASDCGSLAAFAPMRISPYHDELISR